MLNTIYKLVKPRKFEIEFVDIDLNSAEVIIRPTHLSICNADQRYYQGKRAPEVLKEKLPMSLIHEGIGQVIHDNSGKFQKNDMVVMIPNTPVEEDEYISENYLRSSKFRASGFDGFMQDCISMSTDRVVKIPDNMDKNVAAFTEFVSVGYHAIDRFLEFSHERRENIAIWGDGNLAFIVALLLKYRLPEAKIYIMGIDNDKLESFSFANEVYQVTEIPKGINIDHAFECVGGEGSSKAIDQIIDLIKPQGSISILGVSENPVPINTRMILEKGLVMFGSSRSSRKDFENTVKLFSEEPEIVGYLSNIVGKVVDIKGIMDVNEAFEQDIRKSFGKTIMHWNI